MKQLALSAALLAGSLPTMANSFCDIDMDVHYVILSHLYIMMSDID